PDIGTGNSPHRRLVHRKWFVTASRGWSIHRFYVVIHTQAAGACLLGVRKQPLRDDEPLDLARALVNPVDTGVAIGALDPELAHVAHSAVDLDRRVRNAAERLGCEKLRH